MKTKACYNCVHMTLMYDKKSGISPSWDCSMSDTPWTGGIAELLPREADAKMEEMASKCNQYSPLDDQSYDTMQP